MRIDVHVHSHADKRLDEALHLLRRLIRGDQIIMATFTDIKEAVTAQTDVVTSAVTLLDALAQQLRDAIAANDPAEVQAVLDRLEENKQALADAVVRNTPTAPPAPVATSKSHK